MILELLMKEVLTETIGSTQVLTLNRPDKRNALNDELIAALKDALREADADENVKCIAIRGAGKDFCSGADLSALQKIVSASHEENLEDARSLGELYKLIRRVRQPVIAAVKGRALAGGFGLALACDVIFAHDEARFGFPEVKIGFVPAMVAAILRRNMTEKDAFATLTLGNEITAAELRDRGIVEAIIQGEDLDSEVIAIAKQYENLSASAVQMTKRLLYDIDGLDFDSAIEHGAKVNAEARMTDDCQEGIAKFLNR